VSQSVKIPRRAPQAVPAGRAPNPFRGAHLPIGGPIAGSKTAGRTVAVPAFQARKTRARISIDARDRFIRSIP